MKCINKLLINLMIFTIPSFAISSTNVGTILQIKAGPQSGSQAYIQLGGNALAFENCQNNGTWHYSIDISGDMGKATLSLALAAYTANKTVKIFGLDTCNNTTGVEDIDQLILKDF